VRLTTQPTPPVSLVLVPAVPNVSTESPETPLEASLRPSRTFPWQGWPREAWEAYRAVSVEYLKSDPGWKVGPSVVYMCDVMIARFDA
jgi:hypothetical protein